ncbi:hypothetical protein HK100_010800 [Physocladia obscura]|uniref:Apple domain-containing protein n=1 Tax=Physocladia obscura TaxID=109957 RepID=A0AAD5TAE3_9FUNG|nr:hypothetical protein HK100_010800 [Physocladia obscura]
MFSYSILTNFGSTSIETAKGPATSTTTSLTALNATLGLNVNSAQQTTASTYFTAFFTTGVTKTQTFTKTTGFGLASTTNSIVLSTSLGMKASIFASTTKYTPITTTAILTTTQTAIGGFTFTQNSNGAIMQATSCDWTGGDIGNSTESSITSCETACVSLPDCAYFTFSNKVCYFKTTQVNAAPISNSVKTAICGYTTGKTTAPAAAVVTFTASNNGTMMIAKGCDYWLIGDIGTVSSEGGDSCATACFFDSKCTHFTFLSGVCYLKTISNGPKPIARTSNYVCGYTSLVGEYDAPSSIFNASNSLAQSTVTLLSQLIFVVPKY